MSFTVIITNVSYLNKISIFVDFVVIITCIVKLNFALNLNNARINMREKNLLRKFYKIITIVVFINRQHITN